MNLYFINSIFQYSDNFDIALANNKVFTRIVKKSHKKSCKVKYNSELNKLNLYAIKLNYKVHYNWRYELERIMYSKFLKFLKSKLTYIRFCGEMRYHMLDVFDFPKEIGQITELISIHLTSMCFMKIPKEIGNLTNLITLDLVSCGIKILPKEIGNLKNLCHLTVNFSYITKIPKTISKLKNLLSIDLSYNGLKYIPKQVRMLKKIQHIDI